MVVIDSGDPRNWETRGVNGFPGHPGIKPADLRGLTRDECREVGVTLLDGFVTRIRHKADDEFIVEFDPMPVTKAREDQRGSGAPRTPSDNAPRAETRGSGFRVSSAPTRAAVQAGKPGASVCCTRPCAALESPHE